MTTTLYQRLGEADGIARLVDDVMAAHLANPLVKTRFENIKDMEHAKRMAREFFRRRLRRPGIPTRARTCWLPIKA